MCNKIFCCLKSRGGNDNQINITNERNVAPITAQPVNIGYYRRFEEECLEEHNRLRALHGCPPLTLNRDLCAYAAEWAKTLAERDMVMEYRSETIYGENLFVARDYNVDASTVVKNWYSEISLFDFSKPDSGVVNGVDQFTQVIWKSTKELGVGIEKRGRNTWIVVNYEPKGNIVGQFEMNIPRLLEKV